MTHLSSTPKLSNVKLNINENHVHLQFACQVEVVSSAILNGGYTLADHILNLKVPQNFDGKEKEFPPPQVTIQKHANKNKWNGKCVGMMTSNII